MGTRLSARRFGMGTRLVALSLALTLVRMRPAAGEPGDIFTVAAPVSSGAGPAATPIADGDSSVSTQTGAFTYAYPISLPPGRGGAKPSLSLSYTSQGPIYGTLAAGWSLSLPMIYEDTSAGRLSGATKQYISSMAGGERLIPVTEPGPAYNYSYRAQHDASFTRYQLETQPAVGYLWRALSADGTTYYFGHKDSHTTGCANVSYGYAPLTRTQDAFGNAVDYVWEPGVAGECRIRAITWGQNSAAGVGYFAAIEFNYSTNSYTCANVPIGSQTSYRTGAQIVSGASQLDSIRIAAFPPQSTTSITRTPIPSNPEHTRTISLTYSTNPNQSVSNASSCTAMHGAYRELLSIQESAVGVNSPLVTLPKTDFRYGEAVPGYNPGNPNFIGWVDAALFNLGWGYRFNTSNEPWPTVEAMMIDLDGDGRIDRLVNEPYRHESGRLFCNAHWYKNTVNGFTDGGTIPMPTVKWATPTGTSNPYSGGLTANSRSGVIERCALNYQRTAYRNTSVGGVSCNNSSATSCGGNDYCTPVGKPGYGTDCANSKAAGGDTFIAWRWYDIDGDRRPDLVGSPVRGGLGSYDLQYGKKAPDTTILASTAEPAIFGTFPACPPDRFPSQASFTSDSSGAYTMCKGMYPYFVYHNNGDGSFGGPRNRTQQRNWFVISPPPHDSWGPSPTTILYQPVPLESDSGDSALWSTPVGQDSGSLDIDGDGYVDGVNLGTSSWSVWRNDATGTGQMIPMSGTTPFSFGALSSYMLSETQKSPDSQPVGVQGLEDFNGDGLLDHWNVGTVGDVMAAVVPNDGTRFSGPWAYLADRAGTDAYTSREEWDNWSPYYVHKGRREDKRRPLDVDRDGRDDIVRFADGSTTVPTIQFNHGGQFGAAAGRLGMFGDPWTPPIGDGGLTHRIYVNDGLSMPYETWEIRSDMVDLDGDGYLESVDFGSSPTPQATDIKVSTVGTLTHPGRLLYEIKNNTGATTTVNYASIHSSPTVTYSPGRVLPSTQWVVQNVTTSDAWSGNTSTTSYQYKNPIFSPSLEGLRTWAFRGFEEVTSTAPSGMQTIERYDYTVDYTGRLKTMLVVPAATDSPTPIAGEVRSIDETTWEQRTLFGGLIKTFHATAAEHWTCKNAQTEAACRANTDTYVRTVNTLTPLVSTTGPDTTTQLLWQVTGARSQTAVAAADGDRLMTNTYGLAADAWTYRLRPTTSVQQVQQAGQMVMFAKSAHTWDPTFRVPLTDESWVNNNDSDRAITRREFDMKTGALLRTWKPVQWAANPNTTTNTTASSLTYDARKLFVIAETNELGHVREYVWEPGTGTKLETLGPNAPTCAQSNPPTCPAGQPLKEDHRIRVDGLGRIIERYETYGGENAPSYQIRKVAINMYVDGPARSVTHQSAIDYNEGTGVVRYAQAKTELDGLGRPLRKTTYALGSAVADAVTSYFYRNDGSLAEVRTPDPSTNNSPASTVSYFYTSDSLGRPLTVRRPDSGQSGENMAYDGLTQTTTEVLGDSIGQPTITRRTSDAFGRVVAVSEESAASPISWATTTYSYDAAGHVAQIVDPENVTTSLSHDFAGHRTQVTRASKTWTFKYDANGNVKSQVTPCSGTDCALYTSTIVYDALDRPQSKMNAQRDLSTADLALFGSSEETFLYDLGTRGQLYLWRSWAPGANAPTHTVQGAYNLQGQPTNVGEATTTAGYNLWRPLARNYNLAGGVVGTHYYDIVGTQNCTDGSYSEVQYDNRGLPLSVQVNGCLYAGAPPYSWLVNTRNVSGLVTQIKSTAGSGPFLDIQSNWIYDKLGRITDQTVQSSPTHAQVVRQKLEYFGNDDLKTLDHWLGTTNHRQFSFGYDARHQLLSANETTTAGYFSATYQYGLAGRFTRATETKTVASPGSNVLPRDVQYQYAGSDPEQLTALISASTGTPIAKYSFDAAGNQTLRCEGNVNTSGACLGPSLSFVYDGKDQLRRVTRRNAAGAITGSEEYWYDLVGNRTQVVKRDASGAKTELVWTLGEVEAHYDAAGTATRVYSHVSMGGPTLLRLERSSDGPARVEYQFHGLADNTIAAVDQSTGTVNTSFSYAPFGEVIESTNGGGATAGTSAHLRRMNDKQIDEVSELAYYGARYYDRTSMGWTQADPLFRLLPDLAKRGSPHRANLYQFSLSNPLRYTDPDGRDAMNVSSYKSEAEIRNAYAAALEAEGNWMVSGSDHFSDLAYTAGYYYGGNFDDDEDWDGEENGSRCPAQAVCEKDGIGTKIGKFFVRVVVAKVLGNFASVVLDEGEAGGCDDNPDCQQRRREAEKNGGGEANNVSLPPPPPMMPGMGGSFKIYSNRELTRRADEPARFGRFHTFPESFNKAIFENGTRTVTPSFWRVAKRGLSNDSVMYALRGVINGVEGTFEIATRPSISGKVEVIMHRFFRPDPKP